MDSYITQTYDESLRDRYVELCLELGLDDEAGNIPINREEIEGRIKALTFELMHKKHIR